MARTTRCRPSQDATTDPGAGTDAGRAPRRALDRGRALAAGVGAALLGAAVLDQLRRPPADRDWHGRLAGVVPYDLRPPTPRRVRESLWAPTSPRLWLPRACGVGWSPNLARVLAVLRARRTAAARGTTAPRATATDGSSPEDPPTDPRRDSPADEPSPH